MRINYGSPRAEIASQATHRLALIEVNAVREWTAYCALQAASPWGPRPRRNA
jgi:hypothetical protein